jgi:hypothetical protein
MVPATADIGLVAARLIGAHGHRAARRMARDEARRAVAGPERAGWLEVVAEIDRQGSLPIGAVG